MCISKKKSAAIKNLQTYIKRIIPGKLALEVET